MEKRLKSCLVALENPALEVGSAAARLSWKQQFAPHSLLLSPSVASILCPPFATLNHHTANTQSFLQHPLSLPLFFFRFIFLLLLLLRCPLVTHACMTLDVY